MDLEIRDTIRKFKQTERSIISMQTSSRIMLVLFIKIPIKLSTNINIGNVYTFTLLSIKTPPDSFVN